jgi:ABC-2 type transport system ATP-binding protein
MSVLEVCAIRKAFGHIQAVDSVSFSVDAGQVVGLLGPNGAGKTTTISMLTGLVRPDSGQVRISGSNLQSDSDPVKRMIGLVPQELALYDELSAGENLRLFGSLYSLPSATLQQRMAETLELVGLADRRRDYVGTYSSGMKRRLNLAAALLHDPEILLLDEPTVGVDPQSRNAIFENLETLKRRGKALVYTTHYMEEAERLCDRVVIIDHGKVIADDIRSGLYARIQATGALRVELAAPPGDLTALRQLPEIKWVNEEGNSLRIGLGSMDDAATVLQWLRARGCTVTHFASERASLEAVFLHLTGRNMRDS